MSAPASLPKLRFLCFGVGAIGTYIGGSLALAGHDVVFIERPAPAEEARRQGLTLENLPDTSAPARIASPRIVESIDVALTQGPFDVAILAVKAYDTRPLADSLRPYAVAMPPILSFQNGVENEGVLAEVFGKDRVLSGTVTTAVGRNGIGSMRVERLRGIGVAVNHPLGASLVGVMNAAGLRARAYSDPAAMKWSKMLTNLLANATSAILDLPPAEIFAHPGLFDIETRMLRETLAVMRAQKIGVVDLPATPVRLLAWIVSSLPQVLSRPLLMRAVGAGRGAKMPSFHIDLYQGRGKSEVDALNGAVVRCGARLGIPTPVNAALTQILLRLTSGELPIHTFTHNPQKLIDTIPHG